MQNVKPVARTNEIVVLEADDETLVYDLRKSEAHCLNETAAFVWKNCDGGKTVSDISTLVEKQFGAAVDNDFVWLALEQLKERDLLTEASILREPVSSRREMIKRVGLASIVAAPIIASLVAPRSAYAVASCSCSAPANCAAQLGCPSTTNCNGAGLCAP